jgi:hypothetical protein
MIGMLPTMLTTANGPDRLLDCLLHEFLTGQSDKRPSIWMDHNMECSRDVAQQHGEMLVDLGAERRIIRVPEYTANVETLIKLLPKDVGLRMSYVPDEVVAHAQECETCAEHVVARYMVSLWLPSRDLCLETGTHNKSMALAMAVMLVALRINA